MDALPVRIGAGHDRLVDRLDAVAGIDAERFATVVLDSTSAVAHAGDRLDIRWKNARRILEDDGFAEVADAIATRIEELGHGAGAALAFVATPDRIVLEGELAEAPDDDVVRTGRVPSLAPILELEKHDVAHVIVHADRTGADLIAVGRDRSDATASVEGDDEHVHRSKGGGWSQQRFQQRAENTWEDNARDTAEAVEALVDRLGAELIVVTGDVRAVGFLREHLAEAYAAMVVDPSSLRDGPGDERDDAALAVADHVARAEAELLRTLRDAAARGAAAVGPEVVDLLGEGLIGTLAVGVGGDEPVGYLGSRPELVAGTEGRLERLGEEPVEVPLVDLAVFAAARTGAAVRVVPTHADPLVDGVGGLRRDA